MLVAFWSCRRVGILHDCAGEHTVCKLLSVSVLKSEHPHPSVDEKLWSQLLLFCMACWERKEVLKLQLNYGIFLWLKKTWECMRWYNPSEMSEEMWWHNSSCARLSAKLLTHRDTKQNVKLRKHKFNVHGFLFLKKITVWSIRSIIRPLFWIFIFFPDLLVIVFLVLLCSRVFSYV